MLVVSIVTWYLLLMWEPVDTTLDTGCVAHAYTVLTPGHCAAFSFLQVACRLLAPICPHTCEHIWGELLKRPGLVVKAGWPQAPAPDFVLQRAAK